MTAVHDTDVNDGTAMRQRDVLLTPAAVAATALMIFASVVATLPAGIVVAVVMALIGMVLTSFGTVGSGSHLMVVITAAYLLVLLAVINDQFFDNTVLPWAASGLVILLYVELVQQSFLHRRRGVATPAVIGNAFAGLGVVAAGSLLMALVVTSLTSAELDLNWLLVPLSLGLLVIGAVGLAYMVARQPGEHDKRRWKPGERMIPPAVADDDPLAR